MESPIATGDFLVLKKREALLERSAAPVEGTAGYRRPGLLERLKDRVDKLQQELPAPGLIVLTSSSELFLLSGREGGKFLEYLRSRFPGVAIHFSSQACLGMYAALLDFHLSPHRQALLLMLESPADYPQYCLDAVGAGIGGDELSARDACGYAYVEKKHHEDLEDDDILIESVSIFAQSAGMTGTTSLIRELTARMIKFTERGPLRIVSPAIHSRWSTQILKGFARKLPAELGVDTWEETSEPEKAHYLSLKPIMELDRYEELLEEAFLYIPTLGAAGRFGSLLVSRHGAMPRRKTDHPLSGPLFMPPHEEIRPHNFDFNDDYGRARELDENFAGDQNVDGLYQGIEAGLKYVRPDYRQHNEYFQWIIQL